MRSASAPRAVTARVGLQVDGHAQRGGQHALGLGPGAGIVQAHVQRPGAHRRLELGRRALGDDAAVVDDGDAVGELVGLVEVLRRQQHGGARATSTRTISHTWLRLRGSSPVVGSSRNSRSGVTTMLAAMSSRRRMPPE